MIKKRIASIAGFIFLVAGTALACNLMPVSSTLEAATAAATGTAAAPTFTPPAGAHSAAFAEYPALTVALPAAFSG
jgi:hypothetical protein